MTSFGNPDMMIWHRADGEVPPHEETDFDLLVASEKVYQKQKLTAVEAQYMASQVPGNSGSPPPAAATCSRRASRRPSWSSSPPRRGKSGSRHPPPQRGNGAIAPPPGRPDAPTATL